MANMPVADEDELGQFPSAASPLSQLGLDPDEVRANPQLLAQVASGNYSPQQSSKAVAPSATPEPTEQNAPKSPSAQEAGKLGGAATDDLTTDLTADKDKQMYGYASEGLGMLNRTLKDANYTAEGMSTEPPADLKALQERRDKLATPAPRFDPISGKQLTSTQEIDPQTGQTETINPKASTGTKIWRGIRGGLVGLGTGGVKGAIVGAVAPGLEPGGEAYSAPSKAYTQAEQRREGALANTDTDIANSIKTWKDAVDAENAKAGKFLANATLGKDLVTSATSVMNAVHKPETQADKDNEAFKLTQAQFAERQKQLTSDPTLLKLPPIQKALYLANGKLPDPREPNEADIQAADMAKALVVFKNSHDGKGPQSLEEFNQVVAAAKGDLNKGTGKGAVTPQQLRTISDKKAAEIDAANKQFAIHQYTSTGKQDYQRALQEAQNHYEEDMANIGQAGSHMIVTVDSKGQAKWTPEQAAPAPTTPAQAPPSTSPAPPANSKPVPRPPEATHTVRSKVDGKLHWTNAQMTADYGVVPDHK